MTLPKKEDLTPSKKLAGNNWKWGGVTSFVVDDYSVVKVNLVKTCGSYYEPVTLTREDKVDKSKIGDEPGRFDPVGIASICTDPTSGKPEEVFEIYVDSETEEWTYHELQVEVEE